MAARDELKFRARAGSSVESFAPSQGLIDLQLTPFFLTSTSVRAVGWRPCHCTVGSMQGIASRWRARFGSRAPDSSLRMARCNLIPRTN